MSASALFLTGRNRRRALKALIAAPVLALGVAAGSGTAHASSLTFVPAEVQRGSGHCSVSGWPGGTIFCGTSVGANFPNGTQEIFGIGLDDAVWTDWGTEASPSGWKALSGDIQVCDPSYGRLSITNDGDYGLAITCFDSSDSWTDFRSDGPNGTWSGWESGL